VTTTYIIALSQHSAGRNAGTDVAEHDWRGQHYRVEATNGATMRLARTLVSAGAPDAPWQAVRSGRVVLMGGSLHRVDAWVRVMEDPSAPAMARVTAADKMVERAEGKPVQRVINTTVRPPLPLDLDKLTPLQLEVLEDLLLMMRAPRTANAPQIEVTAEERDEITGEGAG
jgi:hypothetical protein